MGLSFVKNKKNQRWQKLIKETYQKSLYPDNDKRHTYIIQSLENFKFANGMTWVDVADILLFNSDVIPLIKLTITRTKTQ